MFQKEKKEKREQLFQARFAHLKLFPVFHKLIIAQ